MWLAVLGIALALEPTATDPVEEPAAWESPGWGWGALPALNYDTDRGLGFGAVAELYRYDGETSPYKVRIAGLFFMTTQQIHDHALGLDVLDLADGRLRLTGALGLRVSRTDHFCGLGGDVTCDPAEARQVATELGLEGAAREALLETYYRARFTLPYGTVWTRYRPWPDKPYELVFGTRFAYHSDGDLGTDEPFPNSVYSLTAQEMRTEGLYSYLSAGLMLDTRDFEPAPARGLWAEATVRGASKVLGSAFDAFGVNLSVRAYAPLRDRRLVLATRVIADGLTGAIPPLEQAILGGTTTPSAYGGSSLGRGVRSRRYRGRVTLAGQAELRWWFLRFRISESPIDLTAAAFVDAGHVAERWSDLGGSGPRVGEGLGLRITFDDSFVVRLDTAVSAVESVSPYFYFTIGHPF